MSRLVGIICLAVFCGFPPVTLAQHLPPEYPDAEKELTAWLVDPGFPVVQRLYYRHRLLPLYDPEIPWTTEDLRSIEKGAAALPREIADRIEAPILLKRVEQPCLFGVGRYNLACPSFDGPVFYVYDLPPVQGEGPVERMAALHAEERRDLQRRRLAVHALMHRFDEIEEWSEEGSWREINGWESDEYARNRDRWGYSRYLGTLSARLDLVTFAETFFVRPDDVVPPDERDRVDIDMSVRCQEFTKSRFLRRQLEKLSTQWQPPPWWDHRCPAFETAMRPDDLKSIDLLLAAASADRPESLYGHLLLHVRFRSGSEGFEPVYQFGAVTDTGVGLLEYFSKGLFGGFLSVLEVFSFRSIDRLFLQYEQRTLRRFKLHLTPQQSLQVLQRIWEVERRYRFEYYFLQENCASFLMEIIAPALDIEVKEPGGLVVAPTDVLDALAETRNIDGEPLLRKRPDDIYSNREVALTSVQERRELFVKLLVRLPPRHSERLRRVSSKLDEPDPFVRRDGYREMQDILEKALVEADDETRRMAIEFLYLSGRVERFFMEVALYRSREVRAGASTAGVDLTAAEILDLRRDLYRSEDLQKRQEKMLQYSRQYEDLIAEGPTRAFTDNEMEVFTREQRVREAFHAVLDTEAAIIEQFMPALDAVEMLEARREIFMAEQRRRDALSLGPSGKSRIGLGGAWQAAGDVAGGHPAIGALNYSFIYERLGAQRRRGFRSDIESRSLGVDARVPVDAEWSDNIDLDVTLMRFLTIEQQMGPIRNEWMDSFGWGFDIGLRHDGRRELDFQVDASVGLLYPLYTSDHVANHLVVGIMPGLIGDIGDGEYFGLVGGTALLRAQFHLYGAYTNVLQLEASSAHYVAAPDASWRHLTDVTLGTRHGLLKIGEHPLVLIPRVRWEFTNLTFGQEETFEALQVGLGMELPL